MSGAIRTRSPSACPSPTDAVIPGGVFRQWLPFKWSKETDDVVEKSLEKIGFYPRLPNKKISYRGNEIELPDDIYRRYAIDFGQELKKRFKYKIDSTNWDRFEKTRQTEILEKIRYRTTRAARGSPPLSFTLMPSKTYTRSSTGLAIMSWGITTWTRC